jgi:hypothetical protein
MTKRNVFTIIVALLVAVSGFSANTGTLVLTGTVAGAIDITVTPNAASSALVLTVDATLLTVASINEKSNLVAGYDVTLSSLNGVAGGLASGSLNGATDSLAYDINYGGADLTMASGLADITSNFGVTGASGLDKDLKISYIGNAGLAIDTYTDTLTLTIASK